jgi:dTDP-glucose 4,6-dehydratase
VGEVYNIGGTCALRNLEVVERVLAATGRPTSLIQYVADRPAHDVRYALTSDKIQRDTGWAPEMPFERGLAETIAWYQQHGAWLDRVRSGDYREFYAANYDRRQ